jgi:dihydroneopterin aldolase
MFVQTVALKDVKFYAFHGFYPEERLIGTHFFVDVEVSFVPNGDTEELNHTVNYEVINTMITREMQQTKLLLETVVKGMITAIVEAYPFIKSAKVGIRKLNPPMEGEVGHSFVQLSYTAPNH